MKKILEHLKENWIKYGFETFVIVVGILGAFTLNNWNEARKDDLKEIELLLELKENLLEDINEFEKTKVNETGKINDINKLITHLETGRPYTDSVSIYFTRARHLERFEINSSAYETLKSAGFELLSSKSLKKNITYYYDVGAKHSTQIVTTLNHEHRDTIERIRREHMKTYEGNSEQFLFYVASQDRFVINYLHRRIDWKKNFIRDLCNTTIEEAEALVSSIDKELTNLGI